MTDQPDLPQPLPVRSPGAALDRMRKRGLRIPARGDRRPRPEPPAVLAAARSSEARSYGGAVGEENA
ncbi:hypothetical protein OG204_15240 [Streptomyces sp. NBC_01387]|uniref:hypothetical protein n=1 Tax=unclassified Streptomyces TaxID=2593676 RepID=UPI002024D9F9|nr:MULTISPECIES: hypothetical protein [unclassified Streptomyces]MCX4550270.1 hypothetical protein [Streptomyces sp. NBC_01500]WSC21765.1 hypothetical protein OIE60_19915 [Streptomyces sp. NBC_01766]WSV55723.1 hypothetical protein OG282_19585 [Streptomyces sp. NBC_01014]